MILILINYVDLLVLFSKTCVVIKMKYLVKEISKFTKMYIGRFSSWWKKKERKKESLDEYRTHKTPKVKI